VLAGKPRGFFLPNPSHSSKDDHHDWLFRTAVAVSGSVIAQQFAAAIKTSLISFCSNLSNLLSSGDAFWLEGSNSTDQSHFLVLMTSCTVPASANPKANPKATLRAKT